jgi:hypothetical protein
MANKIYGVIESAITWRNSGGGGTKNITLTSLGAGEGRQGAYHDLTATARSHWFTWRAWCQFGEQPIIGQRVGIFLITAQGSNTHPDNDDGTGDIPVSSIEKLRNAQYLGSIVVDQGAVDIEMVGRSKSPIWISEQVVAPAFWNFTSDAFTSDATEHGFDLVPVPQEVQ